MLGPVRKTAVERSSEEELRRCLCSTEFSKVLPAVCLATSMAWAAESPFIGGWKLNPQKSRMPDEMKIESMGSNKYTFNFDGTPEIIWRMAPINRASREPRWR